MSDLKFDPGPYTVYKPKYYQLDHVDFKKDGIKSVKPGNGAWTTRDELFSTGVFRLCVNTDRALFRR